MFCQDSVGKLIWQEDRRMCISKRATMRQVLKCGASYNCGNGKNAKLEVITAVLIKIQVVWDIIPWHLVLWCLDTEYRGSGFFRNVNGYLLTNKAVPEDRSFLVWMLLQYREHETVLLLTGSDHKLRTELDPPAGKSMPLWDLLTHYSCGCMLICDRGWWTREQLVTVSISEPCTVDITFITTVRISQFLMSRFV